MSRVSKLVFCLSLIISSLGFSQVQDLSIQKIDEFYINNADAVIRSSKTTISILAYNKIKEINKRIVTVLNSKGEKHLDAYAFYDNSSKIKTLEATIYDKNGHEITKIKKGNFKDVSAVDGGTLYSDHRLKYLEYTALEYPYTVVFESEIESSTTAFITPWLPIEDYRVSTEYSKYKVLNESGVKLKTKKLNFDSYNISEDSEFEFTATNLSAIEPEVYSTGFKNLVPYLKVALEEFDMKGVKGTNKNWADFGKWIHDDLISDTRELPNSIIEEVKGLITEDMPDIEKMKVVYKYVQDKTRYISVQVGIGGWRPIVAEDVNRLGYGDCKGLSNYTKALLEVVGIPSYYAVIYGGRSVRSFDKDFSATEGNHAVLAVPYEDDYIWLECTSQTAPFGYIANFTDDRDALLITPSGGEIVHTTVYSHEDNVTQTKADIALSIDGHIKAKVEIITEGVPYGIHSSIEDRSLNDQKLIYKENYWEDINRLNIESISFLNNKESIQFTETIDLTAKKYGKVSGGRIMFIPNFFNKQTYIPPKDKNRISDIKIDRGLTHKDEYFLSIPENTIVEAVPNPVDISSEFGTFRLKIIQDEDLSIRIKRELILKSGVFDASKYSEYRNFRKAIAKADKSKMVLKIE